MLVTKTSEQLPAADDFFRLTLSCQNGSQPPVTYRFDFPTAPAAQGQTVEVSYQNGRQQTRLLVTPQPRASRRIARARRAKTDSPLSEASEPEFHGRVAGPRYSRQAEHKETADPNSPFHRSFSILEDIFVLAYKSLNMNELRALHATLFKFNRSEPTFVLRIKRLKAFSRNERLSEAMAECVRTARDNYAVLNKVTVRKDKNITASYTLYRIERRQLGAISGPGACCPELLDMINELLRTGLRGDGSLTRHKDVAVHNLELLAEPDSLDGDPADATADAPPDRSPHNPEPRSSGQLDCGLVEDQPSAGNHHHNGSDPAQSPLAEPTVVAQFYASKDSPNWEKKITVFIK